MAENLPQDLSGLGYHSAAKRMDTTHQTHAPDAVRNTWSAAESLFAGPGLARAVARSLDWASTSLGPVDGWPQSLRTAVDVCLGSRFATALLWGPDLVMVHNDAHIPILGTRFPGAMGRPAADVLSETWQVLGPLVTNVLAADVKAGAPEPFDLAVTFDRGGALRPGHLTVSISAVHDESGRPAGVMIAAVEMEALMLAEAALRESEEQYRSLFESNDRGFVVGELVRDALGAAVDYRFLDANEAGDRIGRGARAEVVGRRRSAVLPADPAALASFAAVVDTGQPMRYEFRSSSLAQWFDVTVFPRGGDRFAALVDDITARKQAEAALREGEARQSYLVRLNDALRSVSDAREIQRTAMRVVGEYLDVDRVLYAEFEPQTNEYYVADNYVRPGFTKRVGRFPANAFSSMMRRFARGETPVIDDVRQTPVLTDAEKETSIAAGILAVIGVPLLKEGRLVAQLAVQMSRPREWSAHEIVILKETAERTWAAVERAHAEAKLQETKRRLEEAVATARMAYWDWDPTTQTTVASASMNELFGLEPGQRFGTTVQTFSLVHPDDRERHRSLVQNANERGEGWHTEFRIIRPCDGAVVWLEERATVTMDPVTGARHTMGLVWDITDRKRAETAAKRERGERERSALRRQLAQAEEEERRRLARELHDEVGQHLTALGLGLQALSNVTPANSEVDRRAAELRSVVSTMGRELHDLAVRLRPKALDDFGLEAAIAAYAEEWSRRSGIAVDVHARAELERLPDAVEGAVYRIVQEALTNVARHSGATRTGIVVERRDGHVVAIVEDNGRGFLTLEHQPPAASALGLVGIRERAALLGGTVDVESTPVEGTTVFVRIPIDTSIGAPTAGMAGHDEHADV